MQKKLKFNPHGVFGVISIAFMLGIVCFLQWNVNWWYLVMAVGLYSVVIIFLTRIEETTIRDNIPAKPNFQQYPPPNFGYDQRYCIYGQKYDIQPGLVKKAITNNVFRLLLGCHLSLLFLAVGLLLHFPGEDIRWQYFIASICGGVAIPFLLLKTSEGKDTLYIHGLIALLLISLMFGIAFFYGWVLNAIYWAYFIGAIILYAGINIHLSPDFEKPNDELFQLGCHAAFLFLIAGFGIHFENAGIVTGFFLASIATGIAIPYLLFKKRRN